MCVGYFSCHFLYIHTHAKVQKLSIFYINELMLFFYLLFTYIQNYIMGYFMSVYKSLQVHYWYVMQRVTDTMRITTAYITDCLLCRDKFSWGTRGQPFWLRNYWLLTHHENSWISLYLFFFSLKTLSLLCGL